MFYCVASIRTRSGQQVQEFVQNAKGISKGDALIELYKSGGVIFWFEELSQEDYEILENAREGGVFNK